MDSKSLTALEYPKVLARLAEFCDFSASADLARSLTPTGNYEDALALLKATTEARTLFTTHDLTVGGAHDIRNQVDLCARGGVLQPKELLDIQSTLEVMRRLRRYFEKRTETYPHLAEIALRLPVASDLIETIARCITPTGEVADSASPLLAELRRHVRLTHDRLIARLQRYLSEPETAAKLQDRVITQREGRYVLPLRAECKGQIPAIIHDQSSTGATLFIEPLAVVDLNNAYREAQLAERDEVQRILVALCAQIGKQAGEIIPGVAGLAELDLVFAKAKYAEAIRGVEPLLLKMDAKRPKARGQDSSSVPPPPSIRLLDARHPLLDPATVVPITIDPAPGTFAIVITGPNTGGKTVTLKTVGLLAAMAQSGLHIPAISGSALPCFQQIFADIGDEQSIEQSLSTFSGHMRNIIHILKKADRRCLVILDELGAGTDPQEGAALARAILSHLIERGVTTFVATHYPELKSFAHSTPGVVNASLEFDLETLRPTYKLTLGLPGRSNALAIAARLGLPYEIIEAARAEINPNDLRADELISDLQRQRKEIRKELEKAERARSEARRLERELAARLAKIEEERQRVLEQARAEGELEIEVLKAQLRSLKEELKRARQPLEAMQVLSEVEEQVELLEEKLHPPTRRPAQSQERQIKLTVGSKVFVSNLGVEGTLLSLDEDDAEVQAGTLRLRIPLEKLQQKDEQSESSSAFEDRRSEDAHPPSVQKRALDLQSRTALRPSSLSLHPSPGLELDLRGMLSEDALDRLEDYLDQAYLAGLPFVRIIHGKGTGKLRQVVRQALSRHPYVQSFEEGGDKEGGEGVTVAKLKL